jgi:tetratricopeptide (TPR) repeat protein
MDPAMFVWFVLESHEEGELERTLESWTFAELIPEAEVWRQIGITAAHLGCGQIDEAERALVKARDLAPDNAVMHFYTGIVQMTRARHARAWDEWYDFGDPPRTEWVAYRGSADLDLQLRLERAAMDALRLAIRTAGSVDLHQPLVPDWGEMSEDTISGGPSLVVRPRVGDLLAAIGIDNLEGMAHLAMSSLYTDQGAFGEAEFQIDQAAKLGADVEGCYSYLADRYSERGQYADATRAYLKAMAREPEKAKLGKAAVENFLNALFKLQ